MMRKTKKFVGVFLAVILILSYIPSTIFAENRDIEIFYQLLSDWGNGYSGQIVIENRSSQPINNWSLEFDFGHEMDNAWNANIVNYENGYYYFNNAGYNSVIYPNSNITIGFNGTPGFVTDEPSNYILNYDGGQWASGVYS
jgi:hypothetical protein